MPITLGSLFDGIGGFPLAAQKAGIVPVWASEIEPFPIRVTEKRFPSMKHYGDICGLNGAEIEPVDVVTFGSPCQDLSIAGKRAGLDGSRSGLVNEAVRIITEMRNATNGKHPRWAVWENVPGALSSHDGQDFRRVIEALIRIKDEQSDVPMPKDGKWLSAGEIMGDGYSLAWRVLDASQGWGVAQRRRRVFTVIDFDGECAGQVLFESEGLSGYTPPRGESRENSPGRTQAGACASGGRDTVNSYDGTAVDFNPTDSRIGIKEDGICQTLCSRMGTGGNYVPLTLKIRSGCEGGGKGALIQTDLSATLGCNNDQTLFEPIAYGISADSSNSMLSDNPYSGVYEAETSRTLDCSGGNPACNQGGIAVVEAYALQGNMIGRKDENGPLGGGVNKEVSFTLNTIDRHAVATPVNSARSGVGAYGLDRASFNCGNNAQFSIGIDEDRSPVLVAKGPCAVSAQVDDYLVRRLTPGECCRLQGYPDGWCEHIGEPSSPTESDIDRWAHIFEEWDSACGRAKRKRTRTQIDKWLRHPNSDAAEYKAYGNRVAVPCVFFVLAGIVWAIDCEQTQEQEDTQ